MENAKPLQFNGTPLGYLIVTIVTAISCYIPIVGWAYGFNYASGWIADNLVVNGKPIVYKAGFMETLKFLLVNLLLVAVTLGIYSFWFVPKSYRYMVDHMSYAGSEPVAAVVPPVAPVEATSAFVPPAVPTPDVAAPVVPTDPGAPTPPPASLVQ